MGWRLFHFCGVLCCLPVYGADLLSSGSISLVDSQLNSGSWAANNLIDDDIGTRWLSDKQANDINFIFNPQKESFCFGSLDLINYGVDDRSVRRFMLLRTADGALDGDSGTDGWSPIIAEANPAGLIDHLSWAQGGRITSIDSELNSTSWAAAHLNDGDIRSRWLSTKSNNVIEFAFDPDWDGNVVDAVNIKEFNVFNYGTDDRSVKTFQVEVTSDGVNWSKLEVPGSTAGEPDFDFTSLWNGGVLTNIDSQLNSTSWAAANIHDNDVNSRWLSDKGNNRLTFEFDVNGDGTTGKGGDTFDLFTIEKIYLQNYGSDDRSVRQFQIEVTTSGNPGWTKLEVPGSSAGEPDFSFLLAAQGGQLVNIDGQLNSTSWAAANIHDGDQNSRWLNDKSNNVLDFQVDADGDGTTGAAGDSDDLFTIEKIYLQNYGSDDRSVRQFQVEVKTIANPNWTKLEVPGSSPGAPDYDFLLLAQGGQLVNIDSQLNSSSWAAANIHDGDQNSRWLSAKGNNILDFEVDADGDGTTGASGDSDDLFTIEKIYLQNYGTDDRSVRQFQVEVQTIANPSWFKLEVPGSGVGEPGYNYALLAHGGSLSLIDSQLNTSSWAAANIHDGDQNTRWLSDKQTNSLEFVFDVDLDGSLGDGTNLDTIELINYGTDDRSIQTFEIDIQIASGAWQPVTAPGGGTVFSANMDDNGQSWAVGPFANVTAARIRTLTNHGDPSYTGAREIGFIGDSLTPAYTFTAAMNGNGETFLLDVADRPADVTDVRFRSINNHGDPSYTGAREFKVLGASVTAGHTFTAAMHGNGETFVLDVVDRPVDVTDVRFRSVSNHGDPSYTGAREFSVLGPSLGASHTFTAAMHGNGEFFSLDAEDRPANVTGVRFFSLNNHGDPSYTGAREFAVLGPSLTPGTIFTLPMSSGPHTIILDSEDVATDVIGARLNTIQNHGDPSYTGLAEIEFRGDPVGPSYVFEAAMDSSVQNFSFNPVKGSVFRFHTLSNHGDVSYSGAAELSLNSSNFCVIGEWRMDEEMWSGVAAEVEDSTGNGYDGRAVNGLDTDNTDPAIAGNPGTCRYGDFDGADDYIELPASLPDLTNSFTISGWINARELGNDQRIFVDDETNSGGFAFSLGDGGNGKLRFFSRSVSPVIVDTQSAVVNSNTWHFVAAVHDADAKTRQIYVDGVAVTLDNGSTVSTYTGVWGSDPGSASIGGETNNAGGEAVANWRFDGLIDEVKVFQTALSAAEIGQVMNETHPCISADGVDHFEIAHDGTAVNCQAEPVTLNAHLADHTFDTGYTGTINLTTSTAHGDWSVINANGVLDNGTVNDGAASYTFVAADNGSIELALKNTAVETLNIDVSDGTVSEQTGDGQPNEDQNLAFAEAGFRFVGGGVVNGIGAQISGKSSAIAPGAQTLELEAIRTDGTGGCEAALVGDNDIDLAFECLDPGTCSTNRVAINGTDIGANGAGPISNYLPVSLDFGDDTDSSASFLFNYPDAGQIRLHARYNLPLGDGSSSTINIAGASNSFVVKPAGLCVSSPDVNAACTPASGSCSLLARAGDGTGDTFSFNVQGVAWETGGETNTDFCSGNALTPNFELANIALAANLVAPIGGANSTLAQTSVDITAADNGSKTINQASSEVGVFTITATPPPYLGETISPSTSDNIGRFYPDRFRLSGGSVAEACVAGGYSYMGEDFSVSYRLTALNNAGVTTTNYRGDFIKLNSGSGVLDYGAVDRVLPLALNLRLSQLSNSFTWNGDGTGDITSGLRIGRAISVDGPLAADIGVLPTDGDGVTIDVTDLDLDADLDASVDKVLVAQSDQRYGRLVIDNAFGPEVLDLSVPLRTEYWNGSRFIINTDDTGCSGGLFVATDFVITDSDAGDSLTPASLSSVTYQPISNGSGALVLGVPNVSGPLKIDLDVPLWLEFDFNSDTVAEDPAAEAHFGQYRGNDRIIHWREVLN